MIPLRNTLLTALLTRIKKNQTQYQTCIILLESQHVITQSSCTEKTLIVDQNCKYEISQNKVEI